MDDTEKGASVKGKDIEIERRSREDAMDELRLPQSSKFEDLEHLRQAWSNGEFDFPREFIVSDIVYTYRQDSTQNGISFSDVIRRGARPYLVYTAGKHNKARAKEVGLNQWIIFLWASHAGSTTLVPFDVRAVSPERIVHTLTKEDVEYIGDVVLVKIALPSGNVAAIKAKVDTGAEISSLHAEDIKVVGSMVRFVCPHIGNGAITVPLADQQAVKSSDGGVEYRPVVELDLDVNGKPVRGTVVNLNDRSQMEYPMLVGQNVLEKTGFLINPRQNGIEPAKESDDWLDDDQEINWKALHEELMTVECAIVPDTDKIEQIYKIMNEADITLSDIFRFARTEARQVLNELEY